MDEQKNQNFARRKFLTRTGKAALSVAAAGIVARILYDRKGPGKDLKTKRLVEY